jgi:hypothetical protein
LRCNTPECRTVRAGFNKEGRPGQRVERIRYLVRDGATLSTKHFRHVHSALPASWVTKLLILKFRKCPLATWMELFDGETISLKQHWRHIWLV